MYRYGRRIIFVSPVETPKFISYEAWTKEDIVEAIKQMQDGDLVYVPRTEIEYFDVVCMAALLKTDVMLVVDEMDMYDKSSYLPKIIHYSAHMHIDLICNTRRYVNMPRLVTSQSDEICIFRTNEPRDVMYFKEFAEINVETLHNLPDYHYITYPSKQIKKTILVA
jgi:hypothetical protein